MPLFLPAFAYNGRVPARPGKLAIEEFFEMNLRQCSLLAVALALLTLPAFGAELAIGAKAPEFKGLEGVDGKKVSLGDFQSAKVLIVCFHCNECPVATDYQDRYIEFVKKYQ